MDKKLVRQDLVNVLCDFLQVWIHQILYQRDVYPAEIFNLRKKYDVPVQMSTHEGLNEYIAQFVQSVRQLILQNNCKAVALVIAAQQHPLERFVFEIDTLFKDLDAPLQDVLESEALTRLADLQQYLRATLLRINACRSFLQNTPDNCTFSLVIETVDQVPSTQSDETPLDWVPAEVSQSAKAFEWADMVPIKTIPMDIFRINTYVLESPRKGKQVSK